MPDWTGKEDNLDNYSKVPSHYTIAETTSSTWHYHIRRVGPEGLKHGGGAPPALCGAKLGWDTKIPLEAWGTKDHIPSVWCWQCQSIMEGRV